MLLYEKFLNSTGICTDSRKINKNSIFFALKGDKFNGNKFAKSAIEKGASFAVIDEKEYLDNKENYILVEDTLTTLQNLANFHRKKLKTKIIGITGSNGKTTSKELISSVLKTHFKLTVQKKILIIILVFHCLYWKFQIKQSLQLLKWEQIILVRLNCYQK